MIIGIFDTKKNITGKFTRIWGKWICLIAGFNVITEGLENLCRNQQYIFVSNHESILDIPVALSQLPFNIIFLTKKELFSIPLFGLAMRSAGMIRVDRKNRKKARTSVQSALKALNQKNINVLAYPEGTRSKPGDLLPFKKGSFILAIQSGLPIVPITTFNTGKNLRKSALILNNKVDIKLRIHPPIVTSELDSERDKNQLWETTYHTIYEDLKLTV